MAFLRGFPLGLSLVSVVPVRRFPNWCRWKATITIFDPHLAFFPFSYAESCLLLLLKWAALTIITPYQLDIEVLLSAM